MAADSKALLEIKDLVVSFDIEGSKATAVNGVSFTINEGEVMGLVGESGCGKSVTSLSILRLVPDPPGHIDGGQILFRGEDLLKKSYPDMRNIRGREISMIFQEPMTSLNPVFTVGFQLREAIVYHTGCTKKEANNQAADILERVGISDAKERMNNYPHQFSGGMRQRVMIAMALSLKPALLIADEPTTALDVTIQAQILDLMIELKNQQEGASILLITHDLGVVAETCDRVVVMYAGRIQEISPVKSLFANPQHPYTEGLMKSLPRPELGKVDRLETIPGIIPSLFELPKGCKFCTRCHVMEKHREQGDDDFVKRCEQEEPELVETESGRWARCHLITDQNKGGGAKS